MESHVELAKAVADTTRLRILKLLEGRELCVCQIHPVIGGPLSGLSRHLNVLRTAGLLESRREGKWIFYRQNFDGASAPARQVLGLVAGWLNDDEQTANDREALFRVNCSLPDRIEQEDRVAPA